MYAGAITCSLMVTLDLLTGNFQDLQPADLPGVGKLENFSREISRNDPTPSLIFHFSSVQFLTHTGDCGSMTVAWPVMGNNSNLSFF